MKNLFKYFICTILLCSKLVLAQNSATPDFILTPTQKKEETRTTLNPEKTASVQQDTASKSSPPPRVIGVYNKDLTKKNAGISDYLIVKVENLKQLMDSAEARKTKIVLYLDNRPMFGLYPEIVNIDSNFLQFYLTRNKSSYSAWDPLLRKPNPFNSIKHVPITVGFENDGSIKTSVNDYPIVIIRLYGLPIIICILVVCVALYYFAVKSNMLCEKFYTDVKPTRAPYSLALCQMAFWFSIVVSFYLALYFMLFEQPDMTPSVLILIGISSGTALTSSIINKQIQYTPIEILNKLNAESNTLENRINEIGTLEKQTPQPVNISELIKERETAKTRLTEINIIKSQSSVTYKSKESNGFLKDILTDQDGVVSFSRFQIVVWTIFLGLIFIYKSWSELSMPDFNETLLALMGISSGTYLGFKMPEIKK